MYFESQKISGLGKGRLYLSRIRTRMRLNLLTALPMANGTRFLNPLPLRLRCYDQEVFSVGSFNMVNVLGATRLNIRPLLIFFVMAETALSRSRLTLKSSLARAIMSVT